MHACLAVLTSLIVCRTRLPPKDRSLARLLVDVPALPQGVVTTLFEALQEQGGEHATLALIAARDLVLLRPSIRFHALNTLLAMAVSPESDLR